MKHDSDGFARSVTGVNPIDAFMLRNAQGNKLISSVIHGSAISASKKRMLDYVIKHPKKKPEDCAYYLGLATSSVLSYLYEFLKMGYVKTSGGAANVAKFEITESGKAAAQRVHIDHAARHKNIAEIVGGYEAYVPPKPFYARSGATDAMNLKSVGTKA